MHVTRLPGWTLPSCNDFMWGSANPSSWSRLNLLNYFNTGHSNTEWLHIPMVLQLKWMGRSGGFTSTHKPVLKITLKLHKKRENITSNSIKNWIILYKVERLCSTLACVHKRCDSPSSKAGRSICPGDEICRAKHPLEGFGPAWLRPDICWFLMKKERNLLLWKSKWILG